MHCIVMGLGYSISFPLAFVSVLFPFSLLLLFIAILASVCFFFSSLHFDFLATLHVLDFFFFLVLHCSCRGGLAVVPRSGILCKLTVTIDDGMTHELEGSTQSSDK